MLFLCLSNYVSGTIRIGTNGELNGTIVFSLGKMPLMNLSVNYVQRRTETT